MWVCTHATTASRSKRSKVIPEFATFIKQFARPVTLHPLFELANVPCVAEVRQWHLVRPPSPLHRFAINELWSRPALGRAENDHGQRGRSGLSDLPLSRAVCWISRICARTLSSAVASC